MSGAVKDRDDQGLSQQTNLNRGWGGLGCILSGCSNYAAGPEGARNVLLDVKILTVTAQRCLTLLLLALSTLANAQSVPRPQTPVAIQAPADQQVLLMAHASGVQIYTCHQSADGNFSWTLKAPDAELRDDQGAVIGHHYAGPAWKYKDGSEVTGKAAAHVDSPTGSIPWLLANVVAHSGDGLFSNVTTIQRLNTQGGTAPPASGCNATKQNDEVRSKYTADYYFYGAKK